MFSFFKKKLEWVDKGILIPVIFLLVFSVLAVYSASTYVALHDHNNPGYYLMRQSTFVLISFVTFFFALALPFRHLRSAQWTMWGSLIILLALIGVYFTTPVLGARRWFNIKFLTIQPAEFAKLFVVWYLTYSFSRRQSRLRNDFLGAILQPGILVGLIAVLILFEPDTGTVLIIGGTSVLMAIASGASMKYAARILGISILLIALVFAIVGLFGDKLEPLLGYRYGRFIGFSNPFKYADNVGHQLINSYYALRRGGFFGVGIGKSIQKTGYLPFPYTDFILATMGEEIGFLGLLLVLGMLFTLISRIYLVGARTAREFDSLLCIGVASMLLVQTMINALGVTGMLPITGITFPFLSYGGSSLIVVAFASGLAANASINLKRDRLRLKQQAAKGESQ